MIAGRGEAKQTSPGGADFSFDMRTINQTSLKAVLPKQNKSGKANDMSRPPIIIVVLWYPTKMMHSFGITGLGERCCSCCSVANSESFSYQMMALIHHLDSIS